MRRIVIVTIVAAGGALTPIPGPQPSAAIIYPWCAQYGGRMGGAANCGFTTFEQCLDALRGNGGACVQNPWYEPPPAGERRRLRRPG